MEDPSGRNDDDSGVEPDTAVVSRSSGDYSTIAAKPVNRMSLEVLRRSAAHYLGEYLDLRHKIWSKYILCDLTQRFVD